MGNDGLTPAVAVKLSKASEFMEVADVAAGADLNDAAVSLAVSAGINYCDALCLRVLGERPSSGNHDEVLQMLRKCGTIGDSVARHQRQLLNKKNKAQYSSQRCTAREANDALRHAARIGGLVRTHLGVRTDIK